MARREARLIVLCEDNAQERFLGGLEMGMGYRRVRLVRLPAGQGSGELHVRRNYAAEVRAHRSKRNAQPMLALITMLDADVVTTDHRHQQLAYELANDGQAPRQPEERIAILVPKRHVESWVKFLETGVGDEAGRYDNNQFSLPQCRVAGENLAEKRSANALPAGTPASLLRAWDELNRLP